MHVNLMVYACQSDEREIFFAQLEHFVSVVYLC
jgi:hypothetical protein